MSGGVYLWAELVGAYDQATMNAGATAFAYAAPSGYTAWNDVPVAASPLQIDGYATSGLSEVSGDSYAPLTSGTITLSTTQHNDVIVLGIAMGGYYNTSTVATVTDTAGLTWHRRNRRWLGGGIKNFATNGSTSVAAGLDIEIWWAHAPNPLVADVITITPAANVPRDGGAAVAAVGSMSLIAWGVSGANYAAPWDTHSQAGGYVDYGGGFYTPAAAQLYTNATNCFLFGFHGDTGADAGTAWAPWTYVANATGTEHDGNTSFASLIYQQVDEPQEAVNVQTGYVYSGNPYGSASSMMFDSIVAMGETGTAQEIVWFWDSQNTPGGNNSACHGVLEVSGSAPNLVLNYSSSNFNLMVLLQVMIQSASGVGEVTSIGESQGLVSSAGFERRSRVVTATPNGTIATEIWWAWMPMYETQAANDQITIYTSGTATGDIISAQMWGLGGTTGSLGLGDPFWDTNPSLPATNSNTSAEPIPNVTDISTNSRSTMLVAWTGNITRAGAWLHRSIRVAGPGLSPHHRPDHELRIGCAARQLGLRVHVLGRVGGKRDCRVQPRAITRRAGRLAHDRRRHSGRTAAAAERHVGERRAQGHVHSHGRLQRHWYRRSRRMGRLPADTGSVGLDRAQRRIHGCARASALR